MKETGLCSVSDMSFFLSAGPQRQDSSSRGRQADEGAHQESQAAQRSVTEP